MFVSTLFLRCFLIGMADDFIDQEYDKRGNQSYSSYAMPAPMDSHVYFGNGSASYSGNAGSAVSSLKYVDLSNSTMAYNPSVYKDFKPST
jgi:hypothetical protein